jgi:hypothetical protein
VKTVLAEYTGRVQAYIDARNPVINLTEFLGASSIAKENYPILPLTLPFESKDMKVYSKIDVDPANPYYDMHHRVVVQLSYWDIDLDEELGTLEINYTKRGRFYLIDMAGEVLLKWGRM